MMRRWMTPRYWYQIHRPLNWRPWRWWRDPGHSWDEPLDTEAYRDAVAGVGRNEFGTLGYNWVDKPHRLVFDLCREIERLRGEERDDDSGLTRADAQRLLHELLTDEVD